MKLKLLTSFSTYTFVGFLGSGISLLVMPILTHYLTPGDYGTLSLFNAYVTILTPILSFSSTAILNVDYYKLEEKTFRNLFVSSFVSPIFGTVIFFLTFLFFKRCIGELLEIPGLWIVFLPVIALMVVVSETFQSLLIIKKKTAQYSLIYILKVVLEVSITLLFVIIFLLNWKGRIASWFLVLVGILIIALITFKKWGYLKGKVDKSLVMSSLYFGLPLILHQLGKFVINQSDRIFLAKMVSVEETGMYSVGYIIGSVGLIVANAGQKVFNPFFFERIYKINYKRKVEIIRFSYLFFTGLLVLTVMLNVVSPLIFKLFIDDKFEGSMAYVFWVSLSYLFWGGYLLFSNYIFYLKRTKILAFVSIINVGLNLLLNYYLILKFGAIGAAYATATSFFVVFVLIMVISNRFYPMPWFKFKDILRL